ncbi:hypothetical protein K432DRAFT_465445 [Lepidopterella palustris CBS 459.81]|uniref:Uncharacterized protein n=1 Tax=Lepidopterella palustris CBS 459.81 TaxID=1314670 RepID=A0A8E2JAM1_9PEZI|nr:hypothetical protein K432DRAFT_465445 [Lepidopterella palustris CBS 459.81]
MKLLERIGYLNRQRWDRYRNRLISLSRPKERRQQLLAYSTNGYDHSKPGSLRELNLYTLVAGRCRKPSYLHGYSELGLEIYSGVVVTEKKGKLAATRNKGPINLRIMTMTFNGWGAMAISPMIFTHNGRALSKTIAGALSLIVRINYLRSPDLRKLRK